MSVPGLINLNNNCFLNSVLQGLASCQKFQQYVDKVAWKAQNQPKLIAFKNETEEQELHTEKSGFGRKILRFMNQILEYIVGSNVAGIDSLATALQFLIQQLQPGCSTQSYHSASDIQHHLENQSSILEWGCQNDVAEALQVLFDSLKTEAQSTYLKHIQLILCSPSSILSPSDSNEQSQTNTQIEFNYLNFKFKGPSSSQVRSMLGIADGSGLQQGWQSVGISPFEFNIVYKMTCSTCSYQYPLEFQMQNCLCLDIPTNVIGSEQCIKLGTTLSHCLQIFGSINFVEDVRCPRCSLRFLLKQLKAQPEINENLQQIGGENKQLKILEWFASSSCSYMPSDKQIDKLLLSISSLSLDDANFIKGRAIRQTQIASLPKILAIQLKRGQFNWELGVSCKLSGHIPFPINLTPQNIPGLFYQSENEENEKIQNFKQGYELRAVIVHLGAHSGGGHYVVFRRVVVDDDVCWFRISDCNVMQVQEKEILGCEASLLLYELDI